MSIFFPKKSKIKSVVFLTYAVEAKKQGGSETEKHQKHQKYHIDKVQLKKREQEEDCNKIVSVV